MEVIVGNHGMTVLYDEDTGEYQFYCRCLDYNESDDFGMFRIYDTIQDDEIDVVGMSTSHSYQSYESFDEAWSDNESNITSEVLCGDIPIVRRECPYCRYVFNRKIIEKELFSEDSIDSDIKLDIISMMPIEWDKRPKYKIPPPNNLKKIKKVRSIVSISSWDNLCAE